MKVEIWFNSSFNCFQIASLSHQSEYCCHTEISKQCSKNETISKLLFCPRRLFYLWPLNIRFLATRPPAKHGLMNVYGFTLLPRPTRKLEKSQKITDSFLCRYHTYSFFAEPTQNIGRVKVRETQITQIHFIPEISQTHSPDLC